MAKIINLKSQEEITSIIERLWETAEEEIFLVALKDSALFKNIIAMKLLKREADRLGKEVILITKDDVGREMAKRVGLTSRVALPKDKKSEENEEVFREMPSQRFESLIEDEVRARREGMAGSRQFSDIHPKGAIVERHSIEMEQKEKITLPVIEESAEEITSELDDLINEDATKDSFIESIEGEEDNNLDEEKLEDEKKESFFRVPEDEDEDEDDLSIHGLAKGEKSDIEKKSFLSRMPYFNFKKIKDSLKIEEIKPERIKKKSVNSFFSGNFLGLFIGAALGVALLVLYFILPKAEVVVYPKTEVINQDLNITADKGISKIDFVQNKIPGQLIKLDKRQSQEFAATGQRQVNYKAKGTLTIYNEYSSSVQTLVVKTRFASSDGKIFRLTKSIIVPGAKIQEGKIIASSIDAEVEADQPGNDYNVGLGRFTIPGFQGTPKFNAFYAQSKTIMSGGASGLVKVVTQDDYDKAKNEVWQGLQPLLHSEFKSQLPAGLKIIDDAIKEEISSVESNAVVGSPAEKFTITIKGKAIVLLFNEKDILEIIKKKLADKLNSDKDLSLSTDQIDYQFSSLDYSRGQMIMKVKVKGNLVWKVNRDSLKKEIVGQNEKAIRDIFAKHLEINEAKVVFWPFWVNSAPSNLDKVIIKMGQ